MFFVNKVDTSSVNVKIEPLSDDDEYGPGRIMVVSKICENVFSRIVSLRN